MPAGADDRLADAVDELYALDPAQFTARRNALAAAARKAGAVDQAKHIAALRRPTRAAWILNQLSRSDPAIAVGFAELGAALRSAHQTLDGGQIRELTRQRRRLIDETAARAFGVAAVTAPPSALRDDVIATLGAVLADPDAEGRFASGTLITAEDQSGFGPVGAHLSSVPSGGEPDQSAPARPTAVKAAGNAAAVKAAGNAVGVKAAGNAPEVKAGKMAGLPRMSAREAREQARRQAAITKAEAALAAAADAQVAADDAVDAAASLVRQLTDQLADARRREDDALLDARHAELAVHKAQHTLDGLTR